MKFLIIRFSSIGDIVLTTPVIRCLRQQVPQSEVHFLTKSAFKSILEPNPYLDKLHVLADDIQETTAILARENFDYIIDLHHNLRTFRVKKKLGAKSFSFKKLNLEKWLLTNFKINRLPNIHIVDRYLHTLSKFGVKNDGLGLDFFINDTEKLSNESLPTSHRQGYVALVTGGALATKQLPFEKLGAICRMLPMPVVLIGGPEDTATGKKLSEIDPAKIYSACGRYNIQKSADLVRRAKLIITHDTGMMHIAAAYNKPIISIWGNTVPAFGMGPYYPKSSTVSRAVFEVAYLGCRPCSKIGFSKCPKGHFNCMNLQDINAIVEKAKAMWEQRLDVNTL